MDVESSFFEFRPDDSDEKSASEFADESMRSVDAIDDSMRSNDSFSLLRSVPRSARKLTHTIINESEDDGDEKNNSRVTKLTVPKFSLGDDESTDTSMIGRKTGRRAVVLSDSGSDTDDMTPDDDMVMSAATRMSILGYKPKDMVDESDYLDSDEPKSGMSSRCSSLSDLPAVEVTHTEECRPSVRSSRGRDSLQDVDDAKPRKSGVRRNSGRKKGRKTNDMVVGDDICSDSVKVTSSSNRSSPGLPSIDLTMYDTNGGSVRTVKKERISGETGSKQFKTDAGFKNIDEDLQLVNDEVEIVTLSSDDENEVVMTSPRVDSDSQKPDIRKYLAPKSYPNANVVYVPQHVKTNALNKMESLKTELHKMKYLIENIDMDDLPDKGLSLKKRMATVEGNYREQAERVAAMIVEPENPTVDDIKRDGFGTKETKKKNEPNVETPSWDELQAGSNQVQPKMFGKQAMSTHMAERSVILERLRDLHESLASRPPESAHAPAPLALRAPLMRHQLHALAWLRWRETQRPGGGILADDMGLGKTLTMISLMLADKEHSLERDDGDDRWTGKENNKLVPGGTLVVCPASLLGQWAGEVERHVRPNALSVCQHHGASRATQPYKLAAHDLVITTYNIVSRDLDKQGVLMRIRWTRVILDEAHIVRNHKALTSRAVSALEAPRRWCLTGTPVQNKELDVFALLKFIRCTPFDDIAMWKKWIDNKSAGGQERLGTLMRTLLLRRTKQQLQESGGLTCLPARDKTEIPVKLNKDEAKIYEKVSLLSRTLFAQYLQQKEDKRSDVANGFLPSADVTKAYDRMHRRMVALHGSRQVKSHEILVLLLRLRQVCCHAGLIAAMLDPQADDPADHSMAAADLLSELDKMTIEESQDKLNETEEGVEQEGTTTSEALRSVMSLNNPVFQLDRVSSKIKTVLQCLKDNVLSTPDEKAIVVSQWTSVLTLVERSLVAEGVPCLTLSGAVAVPNRAAIVDQLNDPASSTRVLLLSLCAGGVGLNLCGANHLLLLDPHWNPQLEEQAQDRIYRVGQKKPVHIYKFITLDTVEEKIKWLQEHKLELANNVLTGARHNNSKLTIDDLKMLFNM